MRRKNPQRLAWAILLSSFFTCCAVGVGVPLAIRSILLYATASPPAHLEVLSGTILLQEPGASEPIGVTSARPVPEGSIISTDSTSLGLLTFVKDEEGERALGTAQLYNDTTLQIIESRTPRFRFSNQPDRLTLKLERGLARVVSIEGEKPGTRLEVRLPYGYAYLTEGSFSFIISNEETQVTTRAGQAQVVAEETQVTLMEGERTVIRLGKAPTLPVPAPQNLIVNGDFAESLASSWQTEHTENVQPGRTAIAGQVERREVAGRRAVTFLRQTGDGIHSETGIRQVVDRDVRDFEMLALRLDVRLVDQSLEGAGSLSSEFPLMVRLDYTDIYGKDQFWVHGFYFKEISSQRPWIIIGGEKIPQAAWWAYDSGNLLELFQQLVPPLPPQARINAITIYASGHDYESMVSEVELIAR